MRHRHTISFLHALQGIAYALSTQPNFIIHLALSQSAIILGVIFTISNGEWIVLSLIITIGLVIEMINTSIETAVDLITPDFHPLAKIAKDTASGAMLIYAVGSTVVAALIFIPKII